MKRRYAYKETDNYEKIRIEEDIFKGYACLLRIDNMEKPLIVNNGKEDICIMDNGYKLIEIYPDDGKYALTIMFDEKDNIIEWYFDISKNIGVENGIPYEDDLYLDMVITPLGEELILDEDELLEARDNGVITQSDVEEAYQTLNQLEEKYAKNFDKLIVLTDYLKSEFKIKMK